VAEIQSFVTALVLDTAKGVTLSQGPYMLKVVEKDGTKINVWKDYFSIDHENEEFLAHIERVWLTLAFSRIDQLPKVVK